MSIEFKLPEIGEGISSADVAEISVNVGDTISAGQVVMELETEKAVVELPCPHAGKVEEILVKSGDTIQVGQPVLRVAEAAGAEEKPSSPMPKSEAAEESARRQSDQMPEAPSAKATQVEVPPPAAPAGAAQTLEFKLPPLGEGVSSADVAEVLVKPGDTVQAEQTVMELETEKAVVELPAPAAGKVTAVLVSEGDSIQVGQHVLTIETTAGAPAPASRTEARPAPAAASAKEEPSPTPPAEKRVEKPAPAPTKVAVTPTVVETHPEEQEDRNGGPVPAAPATRRLARKLGVDIRRVNGSGRGGRITQEDIQAHVRDVMEGRALAPTRPAAGTMTAPGSIAPPPLPDFSRFGPTDREPLNKIARTAAENLTVSWNVIPHVTHHDRADVTELEAARKRFANGLGKEGPKVTQTAIVIKALATCLQGFPKFNSSLDPETSELVYKRYYHIGCAVDTPHGLVVPVIRDCNQKSILDIAAELTELAQKARDRKLPLDAMQGATCTVTNLGGIGGVGFTPIINYPEVCILGMSRGQRELKLNEGKVEEHLMLPLSLSYDHRVINGADAARFMVTLCNLLSDPFQLMAAV